MDVTLLVSIAAILVVLIILCAFILKRRTVTRKKQVNAPERAGQDRPIRRAAGQRNARRRMQANVDPQPAQDRNGSEDEANDEADDKPDIPDHKLGAKKRAKLAAKAEKKVMREAAEKEREDKKKREQAQKEELDKKYELEREEELRLEEAEKKAREEKEKEEHERYLKLKEAFSVEDEGYEQEENEEQNLLQAFIDYIKENKVVVLEDLAAHFGLKTIAVVERIQELQANEDLTGVIDDRGKFIYISQAELESVAKFVRQRGRVSITELAENSNALINLNPGKRPSMVEAK